MEQTMFGPQIEKEFQVVKFNNQQLLKQVEQSRQIAEANAGEPRAAKAQTSRISDLLGRMSFRNRTAPAGSAS
jgi:hypothetical protein